MRMPRGERLYGQIMPAILPTVHTLFLGEKLTLSPTLLDDALK